MAQRYFGNTLTDLQNALTARDRLAAEQNIASQGNMVKFTQGMQQSAAQQAALRQQAMQQDAANRLAQDQMAQTGYFNRGRLMNEADRIRADKVIAERQLAEGGLDRASRERIATTTAGAREGIGGIAFEENQMADAANNYANLLNARDTLQAEKEVIEKSKSDLTAAYKTKGEGAGKALVTYPTPIGPAVAAYRKFFKEPDTSAAFSNAPYQAQINPSAGIEDNVLALEELNKPLNDKLAALDRIISAGLETRLNEHVTRTPTGKWVSTFKPSIQGGSRFFNPAAPNTSTSTTSAPFFNSPAAPSTAPAPGTLVRQNGVLYRFDGQNYIPLTE